MATPGHDAGYHVDSTSIRCQVIKDSSPRKQNADGHRVENELNDRGYATLGRLLTDEQAETLACLFERDSAFRSHVVMRRHGFGEGDYKYLRYPLPASIRRLRERLYVQLAPVANQWQERMGLAIRFPETHAEFIDQCHAGGQTRPTPLILKYGAGGYNCLHQDLYGEQAFPMQVVILLSRPDSFDGGEFVLTEQRPRMQSRVEVISLQPGHGVAFAVNERPRPGKRGFYRVKHRHGVSPIRRGERFTLGIIFHDAT